MFAFEKFLPTMQSDGGGWPFEWLKARKAPPAPVVDRALLTLRDADRFRRMPALALPPPPVLEVVAEPTRKAKRRGRYGDRRSLHWVLELDGELVRTRAGKIRKFKTKRDALAFA